jgi:zinc protease
VKTASTRRSNGLASIFSQHLLHRHVATQPAAERALCLTALAKIPVADCLAARHVLRAGPLCDAHRPCPDPRRRQRRHRRRLRHVPCRQNRRPRRDRRSAGGCAHCGKPGKVAQRTRVEDLDLTLVEFANGVRLNFKKTISKPAASVSPPASARAA